MKSAKVTSPDPEGATELRYFNGTYVYEGTATVTQVTEVDGKTTEVILDQTIFHPQGGGQPSDIGTITSVDGHVFTVTAVPVMHIHVTLFFSLRCK